MVWSSKYHTLPTVTYIHSLVGFIRQLGVLGLKGSYRKYSVYRDYFLARLKENGLAFFVLILIIFCSAKSISLKLKLFISFRSLFISCLKLSGDACSRSKRKVLSSFRSDELIRGFLPDSDASIMGMDLSMSFAQRFLREGFFCSTFQTSPPSV